MSRSLVPLLLRIVIPTVNVGQLLICPSDRVPFILLEVCYGIFLKLGEDCLGVKTKTGGGLVKAVSQNFIRHPPFDSSFCHQNLIPSTRQPIYFSLPSCPPFPFSLVSFRLIHVVKFAYLAQYIRNTTRRILNWLHHTTNARMSDAGSPTQPPAESKPKPQADGVSISLRRGPISYTGDKTVLRGQTPLMTRLDNTLNIKIVSTDGNEVFFKIKKTTRLNKLKVSSCCWIVSGTIALGKLVCIIGKSFATLQGTASAKPLSVVRRSFSLSVSERCFPLYRQAIFLLSPSFDPGFMS